MSGFLMAVVNTLYIEAKAMTLKTYPGNSAKPPCTCHQFDGPQIRVKE